MIKKYIPDAITCCNFLCGCIATYISAKMGVNYFLFALIFILSGAVFDFFDGMTARSLKVSSPIGKELDSLADATTFGLAPAMMAAEYINTTTNSHYGLVMLIMAAFSIIRLAKFNLDPRQTSSFIGLATPANALFWASLTTSLAWNDIYQYNIAIVLTVLMLVSSYLLISEIPFFSLKFHNLKWADNKIRFIFIIGSLVILCTALVAMTVNYDSQKIILPFAAICVIIVYYILLVIFDNIAAIINRNNKR